MEDGFGTYCKRCQEEAIAKTKLKQQEEGNKKAIEATKKVMENISGADMQHLNKKRMKKLDKDINTFYKSQVPLAMDTKEAEELRFAMAYLKKKAIAYVEKAEEISRTYEIRFREDR